MASLDEYTSNGDKLFHKLHLSSYPIAIKYIENLDQVPEKAMQPSVFGKKMSLCQAFTMARRHGSMICMTSKDNFCTPATAVHRWSDISLEALIKSQVMQGWHKSIEAEKRRFHSLANEIGKDYFTSPVKYIGFVCSSLLETTFIPDAILIYCDGLQLTHIIQALSYEHKHVPHSSFEGFEESCVKGGLIPFLTQKPKIIIPGAGDRAFAGISENELGIGLPAELLFYVMENLFKTGGFMNLGFPQRTMLAMDLNEELTPGFKYLWDKMPHS
jgi:uncharacterized protein (DUF169 family)